MDKFLIHLAVVVVPVVDVSDAVVSWVLVWPFVYILLILSQFEWPSLSLCHNLLHLVLHSGAF